MMPIYNELASDYQLSRAAESALQLSREIKSAQQLQKREIERQLEKKDEIIQNLTSKVEMMQFENREYNDSRRANEKENRDLITALKHRLAMQETENERLREELLTLRQDLVDHHDKIIQLEQEHEKANYIIKNMLKKSSPNSQIKLAPQQQQQQQQHLRQQYHHHLQNYAQTKAV